MSEISAKAVMNLRNKTGLPMMDCKQALAETKGDEAAAEDWLRKKLKGKMDTRTERAAGEGRIEVASPKRPLGVSADDLPKDAVDKERKFRIEQAMESGKPKEIAEKMVEGGMRKFYEEVALLEQPFVKDETRKVKDIVGPGGKIKQ